VGDDKGSNGCGENNELEADNAFYSIRNATCIGCVSDVLVACASLIKLRCLDLAAWPVMVAVTQSRVGSFASHELVIVCTRTGLPGMTVRKKASEHSIPPNMFPGCAFVESRRLQLTVSCRSMRNPGALITSQPWSETAVTSLLHATNSLDPSSPFYF
jgi:hypothetical protein